MTSVLSEVIGRPLYKVDCWNCGGSGEIEGECDCGEDTCCCAEPSPPPCSHCLGHGVLVVSKLTDDNCDDACELSPEEYDRYYAARRKAIRPRSNAVVG